VSTVDELQPVADADVLRENIVKQQQLMLVHTVPLVENGATRDDGR